jgi:uncharacterized membrane protein
MTRSPASLVIAAAAVAGMAISGYLTYSHYQDLPLACANAGLVDCGAVTTSSYSSLLGIPVALLGIGWFAVSGGLALTGLRRPAWGPGRPLLVAWGIFGLAFVLYLVYAELVVIHRICEWCTALHVLVAASLLAALARVSGPTRSAPGGESFN